MSQGFVLFDTAIGACALAWSERGAVGVQLPEASDAHTRARLAQRFPHAAEAAPPAPIREAAARISALLAGQHVDLADIALDDIATGEFNRAIYSLARKIPRGETRTYGELARAAGQPNGAQAVGQAMARNPWPIIVPCHRVFAAGGKPGGFSARGGVDLKLRILAIEGWRPEPTLFDNLP